MKQQTFVKDKEIYSRAHILLPAIYNNRYLSGTKYPVASAGMGAQQSPKGSGTVGGDGKREFLELGACLLILAVLPAPSP